MYAHICWVYQWLHIQHHLLLLIYFTLLPSVLRYSELPKRVSDDVSQYVTALHGMPICHIYWNVSWWLSYLSLLTVPLVYWNLIFQYFGIIWIWQRAIRTIIYPTGNTIESELLFVIHCVKHLTRHMNMFKSIILSSQRTRSSSIDIFTLKYGGILI